MPPKQERFELRMDEEQLARIDSWAQAQPDRPSRAEAARRLLELGLSTSPRDEVRFSDGEKLLLLMMGDLFKHLKIKDPDTNVDFIADVIYGGHYWAPKWQLGGVFHDHADKRTDLNHVSDVLDMWMFIEEAYARFTPEERQRLEEEAGPLGKDVAFWGFDGNHESAQLGIAKFLVEKMDRFTHFKNKIVNSHAPTYSRYCRMLEIFERMRPNMVGRGLSVGQVALLLKN